MSKTAETAIASRLLAIKCVGYALSLRNLEDIMVRVASSRRGGGDKFSKSIIRHQRSCAERSVRAGALLTTF
jgi:hypothetical protein